MHSVQGQQECRSHSHEELVLWGYYPGQQRELPAHLSCAAALVVERPLRTSPHGVVALASKWGEGPFVLSGAEDARQLLLRD